MPNRVHKTDWTLRISLLILAVTGLFAYINTSDLITSNAAVIHTHNVLSSLEEAQNILVDAETGQRGYLLTGKEYYLDPYKEAIIRVNPVIDYVATLTRDNDGQQRNLYRLRIEINKKLVELKETIDLRKQDKLDQALTIIGTDAGREYMSNIREIIARMKSSEQDLLAFRMQISTNTAYRCLWLFPTMIILDIIITNLTLTFLKMERTINASNRNSS